MVIIKAVVVGSEKIQTSIVYDIEKINLFLFHSITFNYLLLATCEIMHVISRWVPTEGYKSIINLYGAQESAHFVQLTVHGDYDIRGWAEHMQWHILPL